nr:PREDICTED: butyrophilin subfamily 2 member A2-like isoform X2 [Lepisosteus oculatus]
MWAMVGHSNVTPTVLIFLCSTVNEIKVIVPLVPVLADEGSDIVLLCHLSPQTSVIGMHVRWFRQKFSEYVYLYKDMRETVGSGYEGRASLFSTELEKGNVSLLLKEVKISDEGPYKCHVSRLESFAEPQLQLTVKRQGSVPLIEVEKLEKDSLKLRCSSQGWYPEPQMVWMDKKGRNITFTAEPARQQDKNSPFSVSSHLYMMRSSNEEVTCVVGPKDRTAHTAQLRTSVKINDHFFESTHPVRLYVSVVVIAFALALMSMAVACLNIRSQERACKEKLREYDSITSQLEKTRREREDQTRVKGGCQLYKS